MRDAHGPSAHQQPVRRRLVAVLIALAALSSCAAEDVSCAGGIADVVAVKTSGSPGNPAFSVTIASKESGCACYADWWEIVGLDGTLLQRRILAHPHVAEQPFSRDGEPVQIAQDLYVIVRAHMRGGAGYGGKAMKGSVRDGFKPTTLQADFAADLATTAPLSGACQ